MTQSTLPLYTLTDLVADLFLRRPGEWIDVMDLADLAGIGGWRTRVSECRTQRHMTIENRITHWPDGRNRSQYRYVPDRVRRSEAA